MNYARNKWTDGEDALMRRHYAATPTKELLALFPGRTVRALIRRAGRLELGKEVVWDEAADKRLIALFPTMRRREIAEEMDLPLGSVERRIVRLGLTRAKLVPTRTPRRSAAAAAKPPKPPKPPKLHTPKRPPCGKEKHRVSRPAPAQPTPWYRYPRDSAEYRAGEAQYFQNKQGRVVQDAYGRPATVFTNIIKG